MRLLLIALLVLALPGCCVRIDKSVHIHNRAPFTATWLDGTWASETDASGNTADVKPSLTVPLVP